MTGNDAALLRERQLLIQQVQHLGETEHREIFNIIVRHDIRYMQNNNGFFIDVETIPSDVLMMVQQFVDYCYQNKNHLDEYDNRMNECKIHQNYGRLPSMSIIPPHIDDDHKIFAGDDGPPLAPSSEQPPTPPLQPAGSEATNEHHLTSVTKRMSSSKFNQAKKRFLKKKSAIVELSGLLVSEPYPLYTPLQNQ